MTFMTQENIHSSDTKFCSLNSSSSLNGPHLRYNLISWLEFVNCKEEIYFNQRVKPMFI